jgi:hypothetical protein
MLENVNNKDLNFEEINVNLENRPKDQIIKKNQI